MNSETLEFWYQYQEMRLYQALAVVGVMASVLALYAVFTKAAEIRNALRHWSLLEDIRNWWKFR